MRVLGAEGHDVIGLDVLASPYTHLVGSIADRAVVRAAMEGTDAVLHAATLHKPHVGSHDRGAFVDTGTNHAVPRLQRLRPFRAHVTEPGGRRVTRHGTGERTDERRA